MGGAKEKITLKKEIINFSKDYNVELRCEKIIQIKGCEKFEMINKAIGKMIIDHYLIGSLFLH